MAKVCAQNLKYSEISLPQEIKAINEMMFQNGKLWIATAQGIYSYSGTAFIRYFDESIPESYRVNTFSSDRYGNLWFGNYNGVVVKFSGINVEEIVDIKPVCKTDNYLITSISIDTVPKNKNTRILITTSGGEIFSYDTITNSLKNIQSPEQGTIYSIKYGYYPTIWLCTADGFYSARKNLKWKKKSSVYSVYHIAESKGKYWCVGRDMAKQALFMLYYNDIDKIKRYLWKEFDLQNLTDKYLKFNEVDFTSDEIAWIASDKGLIRYNPTNARLVLFDKVHGVVQKSLKHIVVQSDNIIWASSSGRRLYKIELD